MLEKSISWGNNFWYKWEDKFGRSPENMPLFHRGDSCRASKGMILEYLILKCFDWEVVLYLLDRNSPPYWGAVNALINKHWRNLCFRLLTCVYTVHWAPQVVLVVKTPPVDAGDVRDRVQPVGGEDPLEEGLAAHSRILAWRIPWTEEPSRLQFMGSQSWTPLKWLSTHLCIYPLNTALIVRIAGLQR